MDKQKRIEKLNDQLKKLDKNNMDVKKKTIRKFSLQRLINKLEE